MFFPMTYRVACARGQGQWLNPTPVYAREGKTYLLQLGDGKHKNTAVHNGS